MNWIQIHCDQCEIDSLQTIYNHKLGHHCSTVQSFMWQIDLSPTTEVAVNVECNIRAFLILQLFVKVEYRAEFSISLTVVVEESTVDDMILGVGTR